MHPSYLILIIHSHGKASSQPFHTTQKGRSRGCRLRSPLQRITLVNTLKSPLSLLYTLKGREQNISIAPILNGEETFFKLVSTSLLKIFWLHYFVPIISLKIFMFSFLLPGCCFFVV